MSLTFTEQSIVFLFELHKAMTTDGASKTIDQSELKNFPIGQIDVLKLPGILSDDGHADEMWIPTKTSKDLILARVEFLNGFEVIIDPNRIIIKSNPKIKASESQKEISLERVAVKIADQFNKKCQPLEAIGVNSTTIWPCKNPDAYMTRHLNLNQKIQKDIHTAALNFTCDWEDENKFTNIAYQPATNEEDSSRAIQFTSNFHTAGKHLDKGYKKILAEFDNNKNRVEEILAIMTDDENA